MLLQRLAIVVLSLALMNGCKTSEEPIASSSQSSSVSSAITTSSNPASTSSSAVSSAQSSEVASSSSVAAEALCPREQSQQSKEAVENALTGLFIQKDVSAIDEYWADPYLQHNPIAGSGVETFRSFMGPFVTSGGFNYELIRVLGECDLAIVLGRYSQTGLIFDMFRVDQGKLVEHWDSEGGPESLAQGPTEVEDVEATDANRETIASLYAEGLLANDADIINSYFAEDALIRRSNTTGADAFSQHLQASGIVYEEAHHIIADGNFVFVMAETSINGSGYAIYDLFRLADGKIVEHWDSRRVEPDSTASGLPIY